MMIGFGVGRSVDFMIKRYNNCFAGVCGAEVNDKMIENDDGRDDDDDV